MSSPGLSANHLRLAVIWARREPTAFAVIVYNIVDAAKLARSHAKLQLAKCNHELSKRQESRENNIEQKIEELLTPVFKVKFQGDPRGSTVKVYYSDNENDYVPLDM
jgi:hypothetical protein